MPSKLEEAIEFMNQAMDLDSTKKYAEALDMYEIGIKYFLDALHCEWHLFSPNLTLLHISPINYIFQPK